MGCVANAGAVLVGRQGRGASEKADGSAHGRLLTIAIMRLGRACGKDRVLSSGGCLNLHGIGAEVAVAMAADTGELGNVARNCDYLVHVGRIRRATSWGGRRHPCSSVPRHRSRDGSTIAVLAQPGMHSATRFSTRGEARTPDSGTRL